MARKFYGMGGGDVLAAVGVDGDFEPASSTYDVLTTRTGSTVHDDLLDASGSPIATVSPDANGRIIFQGEDNYKGTYWLRDQAAPSAARWKVDPVDQADVVAALAGGYVLPGGGIPLTDLATAVQDAIAAAISATIVNAAGDLIVGTADNAVARMARGGASTYLRVNAAGTGLEYGALPAFPSLSGYAVISGAVRQFADWSDTTPGSDGIVIPVWDPLLNQYVPTDVSEVFAQLGGDGRLLTAHRPKYDMDNIVVVEGDPLPADFANGVGGLGWSQQAAPSIEPISHGVNSGANVAAATGVSKAFTSDVPVGDYVVLFIGASGENSPTETTWTPTLSAGAVAGGWTAISPNGYQGGSAQADMLIGKVTTLIPSAATVTVKGQQNRTHLLLGVASIPNLAASSPIDGQNAGQGASGSTLDLATGSTASLAENDELALSLFTGNSGNPSIRSFGVIPSTDWLPLFAHTDVLTSGAGRGFRAFYQVLDSTAAIQGRARVTTSDGTSGAWAAVVATLKRA